MLKNIRLIIFDLDGVLLDSSDAIVITFNKVLENHSLPKKSSKFVKSMIGMHLYDMFKRVDPNLDKKNLKILFNEYVEAFPNICLPYCRLLPHAKEVLKFYHGKKKISLATTKNAEVTRIILKELGVLQYFDLIMGFYEVSNQKPNPEIINKTLNKLKIKPENAVMVGDTTLDIEAGKNAGVYTIGITTGTHSREELESAKPDYIVDNLNQIKRIIEK